jgi:hypothetical protein
MELVERWRRYAGALGLDTSQEFADHNQTDQPAISSVAASSETAFPEKEAYGQQSLDQGDEWQPDPDDPEDESEDGDQ